MSANTLDLGLDRQIALLSVPKFIVMSFAGSLHEPKSNKASSVIL